MIRMPLCLSGIALIVVVSLMVSACVGSGDQYKQETNEAAEKKIVWPRPPEQPRIEFSYEFSRAEDLGLTPGLWGRLVNWIAGSEEDRLVRPTSVIMTPDEVLLVADPGSGAVHRFDTKNENYDVIRQKDDVPLRSPISLALGPKGKVYVSDSALNRIFVIEKGVGYAIPFPTSVALDQPTGLAFDGERLYVVNTRRHQVMAFDTDGQFLFKFSRRGTGKGELNYPTMIWSEPSTRDIWVTDSLNFRVEHFDKEGKFISSFGGVGDATGDLSRPKGLATDSQGNIYVMDALFNSMQIFNSSGELLLYLGDQGREVGQFWLPSGIYIDAQNRIFVADSFNGRIQVFKYLSGKG